jgi:hypothetical protein
MSKNVLFFDPSRAQVRDVRRMLAAANCACEIPANVTAFEQALRRGQFDLLVYSLEHHSLVRKISREIGLNKPVVLLTSAKFEELSSLLPEIPATNIIAKNSDGTLKLRDLVSTVRKIFEDEDIFGVKHYLTFGTQSEVFHIRDSSERHEYIEAIVEFCKKFHLRTTVIQSVELFCEELLMNAIYDAPRDVEGKMLYNHLSRKNRVVLKPKQAARMEFACDGEKLVVSISDPFGAMTWETLQKFLIRCFGTDRKINNLTEEGGAGLGLYFCFASVNSFIVNVDPSRRSEFIGIFDIAASPRDRHTRYSSLHFFTTERRDEYASGLNAPPPVLRRNQAG